jgi:hypothetical protein
MVTTENNVNTRCVLYEKYDTESSMQFLADLMVNKSEKRQYYKIGDKHHSMEVNEYTYNNEVVMTVEKPIDSDTLLVFINKELVLKSFLEIILCNKLDVLLAKKYPTVAPYNILYV